MDFSFPPELEAFRREVSAFLDAEAPKEWQERKVSFFDAAGQQNWIETHRTMAEKLGARGWLSLHWPGEHGGRGASPLTRLILCEELARYHSPGYDNIGVGIIAPTLLLKGTEEQKKCHLPGIARGKVMWCETLSEPDHGSDLASIETFAREEEDGFVVNGQKVWTTHAHFAEWNALLARTDREADPKYRGLTFFLVDMKSPGITVNPVVNMAGHHEFNEVFFDEVRIPRENVVGGLNQGWYVVMAMLDYERTSYTAYAAAATLLDDITAYGREHGLLTPLMEHRFAELSADCEVARLLHYRATGMQGQGKVSSSDAAMCKLFGFELVQRVSEFGMQLLGEMSQLYADSPDVPIYGRVPSCYLRSVGHSLEQGTSEIDRDIIAQRGLGLPRLR